MSAGYEITQVQFLLVLCIAFLAAVLAARADEDAHQHDEGHVVRTPAAAVPVSVDQPDDAVSRSYFRTTSQGELVAMVTSEAEPMGGLMGDAVAQPVFQAGQMLTILIFLFLQSVWFGLAAVALIPLQAWLIPMLQRQINQLNKNRISEVRHCAAEIGETAAGITRSAGQWRLALSSGDVHRPAGAVVRYPVPDLPEEILHEVHQQLHHPADAVLLLSGGRLSGDQGRDHGGCSGRGTGGLQGPERPWKELLTYYNQVQDMSLRWEVVTERFAPQGMIDEALFEGEPDEIPHLDGVISICRT